MPGNDTEDNKTEISDTDRSDTEYLSFYSEESEEMHRKRMEREVYHQMILNNIGYEYLVDVYNRDMLNEIVELIVDTVCSEQEMIRIGGDTKEKIAHYEVSELNKKERDGLLSRYLKFENIELEINDMRLISGLLSGYPEQVFFAVQLIKEKGIEYLRKNTFEIVEYNNKKASILLKDMEGDVEKISFLALLSGFDYISLKFVNEIVEGDPKYIHYIDEFILKSICEYVGVLKEYIRVNETIKDYVTRNNYQIKDQHRANMDKNLNKFLDRMSMSEYDVPEYLFSLKESLLRGKAIDEHSLCKNCKI